MAKLTPDQARKVRDQLQPMLRYLNRLLERMNRVGFLPDDPLMKLATEAWDKVHALWVDLRYQSLADIRAAEGVRRRDVCETPRPSSADDRPSGKLRAECLAFSKE